jgi:two-component system phosphate regulon sensor histidine kinase PhoR
MKLSQRLLLNVLGIVVVLVVAVVLIIDERLHARIVEQTVTELAREAQFVAAEWRSTFSADDLADAAGRALEHRVTLIDDKGVVVGDSEFDGDALRALENHNTRPEVAAAYRSRVGSSRRVSASAGDEELYVAVRAPLGVARVSLPTRELEAVFARARRDVLLAGAVAFLLAVILSLQFSRSVSRPIVELRDVARAIADGDIDRRPALAAPGEVGDLATALHRLSEQLSARLSSLQSERALLSAIVESLEEGVIAVDSTSQVVEVNDAARRLLGVRAPVPFSVDLLPRHGALRDSLSNALRGSTGESVEFGHADRTLSVTARPLPRGGAVLALTDLTMTRRLEAVRRDFVANVSHELRTPLTVVAGFAETLSDDAIPVGERVRFAEMIRAHTARMQRIVDDLLDLSRIESGGWRPNPEWIDIAPLVEDVLSGLSTAASEQQTRVTTLIAPDGQEVFADRTALRQVLSNLLENAIRHTKGGTVTVATALAGEAKRRGVFVSVSDTGAGIAPDHLPRIFERFYRADTGRAREAGGTGLGLAIVRHLVDAHGGSVEASSTIGVGTTIKAFFPAPAERL